MGRSVPDLAQLKAAARRLSGLVRTTPLLDTADGDLELYVKAESLQITGSFKYRGATHAVQQATARQTVDHVVTWSSGNHAQAIAAATARAGIKATIVMPADAPAIKKLGTQRYGATIVEYNRYRESREEIGATLAEQHGALVIPPYDHPDVILGQSTCGSEILDQLETLNTALDVLLIPCGGGGLAAGISSVFHHRSPATAVYGVEPAGFDDHARSFASARREQNRAGATSVCDALLAPTPGSFTWPINQQTFSGVLVVTDEQVRSAMRSAFAEFKLVVEPGGAAALAAAYTYRKRFAGQRVGVVISGGNVDPALFADVVTGTSGVSENT